MHGSSRTRRRTSLLTGACILAITGAGLVAAQSAQRPAAQPGAKALSGPDARLAAAKRVYDLLAAGDQGPPLSRRGVDQSYQWSKRWMEAQTDAEAAKVGEAGGNVPSRTAAKAHLERMRAVAAKIAEMRRLGEIAEFDVACTDYYVADAEELAARAEVK